MTSDDLTITIPEAVLHQRLDAETVMLHLGSELYFGLDEVGTRVWELIKEHGAVAPLMATLLAEYDVDPGTLQADVDRLLGELLEAGLIEVRPQTQP